MERAPRDHLVLLGDSVLDNGVYVGAKKFKQPSVSEQFRAGRDWNVTLCAKDGARMRDMPRQLEKTLALAPPTLLLLSIGGNDGLGYLKRLGGCGGFREIFKIKAEFAKDYEATLQKVLALGVPLVIMTIYCPWVSGLQYILASRGVALLNGVIRDMAEKYKLPVIDNWRIFDRAEDFANAIEPGVPGGHKMVRNLLALLGDDRRYGYSVWDDASYAPGFQPVGLPYWSEERFKPGGRFRIDEPEGSDDFT